MPQLAALLGIGALLAGPVAIVIAGWMGSQMIGLMAGAAAASAIVFGTFLSSLALREEAAEAAGSDVAATDNAVHPNMHLATTARWTATAYGWGALSMMGGYYLSPLNWYHAYQYAALMALFAMIALWMVHELSDESSEIGWLRPLAAFFAVAQLALAFGGIGYLVVSGALGTAKSSWLAHIIFFAGAWMIGAISALALPAALKR